MEKTEEKNIIKNGIRNLNDNKNVSENKEKEREIDKILSEYASKHKTIYRNVKAKSHNPLKLNKTYNSKNNITFGKKISNKKKIEAELFSFSKENRNFFRKALKKYNFQMEVYVPQNLTNKEYSNKNFLINKLIFIENMNKNINEKIKPIKKETKQFSKQYKLIKSDNKEHQKMYMDNLEQIYQEKGFKIANIEFMENENIFTPSFLLDKNFGKNQQKDAYKYLNKNTELDIDKNIMKKLNYISNKYGEVSLNEGDKKELKKYKTNNNFYYNEKDEEMKREIMEEKIIMKMSKKEYYAYSKKLKNDINLIKNRLKELDQTNKKENDSNLFTNRTNYTGRNIKNYLDLNDKTKENQKTIGIKKSIKKKDDENNIFLSARGLDLETDFNQLLPSINSIIETKKEDNRKNRNKTFQTIKKQLTINKDKSQKESKISQLYNILSDKSGKCEYPEKEIESYFKKNSKRQLPELNIKTGSNIHGFFGEFQKQVKDNSFSNIAKGNEYIKIYMDNNYISNNTKSLENKIDKIDEKIKNLHFTSLEGLIYNDKKEILNN